MARIFISYKRVDKEKVFPIVQHIESELGLKCWVDLDGIETSRQFGSVICRAIDSADIILFMHSNVHLNIDFETDWTIKELHYAQAKKKRIVLLKLDQAPLDNIFLMDFGSKNNIDTTDGLQLNKLLVDLRRWLNIETDSKLDKISTDSISYLSQKNRFASSDSNMSQNLDGAIGHTNVSYEDHRPQRHNTTAYELELCEQFRRKVDSYTAFKCQYGCWPSTDPKFMEMRMKIEDWAQEGSPEAAYTMGYSIYHPMTGNLRKGWEYEMAVQWLGKAAGDNHTGAQVMLADMYYWGKETEKAIPWARIASDKGNLDATITLAWCYLYDSPDKYVETIKKAAEMQKTYGIKNIHNPSMEYGELLSQGIGVEKDLAEAIKWFDIAISLAYDEQYKDKPIYNKGLALYQQGHVIKALKTLSKSSGTKSQELYEKIKSELNPLMRKLF